MMRRTLIFILGLLLPLYASSEEEPLSIKIKEAEFGTMKIRAQKLTGSYIQEMWGCRRIHKRTDVVPLVRGSGFGLRARVEVNRGESLILYTKWSVPKESKEKVPESFRGGYFGTLKNGSKLTTCYRLEYEWEMIPGEWDVSVYLVGMDERVEDVVKDMANRSPLLIYRRTFAVEAPVEE